MATKTFTAMVKTQANGSECYTQFEVEESDLEGLDPVSRDDLLSKKAHAAVWGEELVEITYEEGDAEGADTR